MEKSRAVGTMTGEFYQKEEGEKAVKMILSMFNTLYTATSHLLSIRLVSCGHLKATVRQVVQLPIEVRGRGEEGPNEPKRPTQDQVRITVKPLN